MSDRNSQIHKSLVDLLLLAAKHTPPDQFRAFLIGGVVGNVVGNLSDEYWREFMKITLCREPGCDCYLLQTDLVAVLDRLRDDWRKEISNHKS